VFIEQDIDSVHKQTKKVTPKPKSSHFDSTSLANKRSAIRKKRMIFFYRTQQVVQHGKDSSILLAQKVITVQELVHLAHSHSYDEAL